MTWVPLNVHSQFSILDSTASVSALVVEGEGLQNRLLGLDGCWKLYGAVDFYKACKSAGIKPIFGL